MDDSAVSLTDFIREAPQISGGTLTKRLLSEPKIGSLADATNLDVSTLFAAIAELEEDRSFMTTTFKRFEQDEIRIRQSVSSQYQSTGGMAFPTWKIGGRCTPLGFVLLQGLINPELVDYIALRGKLSSLDAFVGKHANTLLGVASFAMQLLSQYIEDAKISGFSEFKRRLSEHTS